MTRWNMVRDESPVRRCIEAGLSEVEALMLVREYGDDREALDAAVARFKAASRRP